MLCGLTCQLSSDDGPLEGVLGNGCPCVEDATTGELGSGGAVVSLWKMLSCVCFCFAFGLTLPSLTTLQSSWWCVDEGDEYNQEDGTLDGTPCRVDKEPNNGGPQCEACTLVPITNYQANFGNIQHLYPFMGFVGNGRGNGKEQDGICVDYPSASPTVSPETRFLRGAN